ncbi:MAG TPA: hypothetical protein VGC86_15860, partial [Afipia sp.]
SMVQPRPLPSVKAGTGQAADKPALPPKPPAEQSASVQPKPAETTAPEAARPMEAKPVLAKPAEVELKPTQDMPPMQTME